MNDIIIFQDFQKENEAFSRGIIRNIEKIFKLKSEYAHEQYIQEFENKFAEYNKSKYAIAVNSGTTALQLALQARGIGKNDEVILPAYTYIATALAVSNLGAKPVFADINEKTMTIAPEEIRKNITKKTKVILPVHIHGNPCDMNRIAKIAQEYDIQIIEDASHGHGAEYGGIKVGNFGIGCFSCYINKNFGSLGNAGLITTNEDAVYETVMELIQIKDNPSVNLAKRTPCRIGILETAVLRAKFSSLDRITAKKISIANHYKKDLPKDFIYQIPEGNSAHVYRDFVIITKNRTELVEYLKHSGIQTKVRYGNPLHLTEYYRHLGYRKGSLPITEKLCGRALCLPISYFLPREQINYIISVLKKFAMQRHEFCRK